MTRSLRPRPPGPLRRPRLAVAAAATWALVVVAPLPVAPVPVLADDGVTIEALASPIDPNPLDLPAVDAVLLAPDPGRSPRLLRVRAPAGEAPVLELLMSDVGGWVVADALALDTSGGGVQAIPWLVALGSDERFVAIAGGAPGSASRLTRIEVVGSRLVANVAVDVAGAIDGAGAADTDGDGRVELLLAGPPEPGSVAAVAGGCGTVLRVLDGSTLAEARRIDAGSLSLGGGALAELDGRPGLDLAATVRDTCAAGTPTGAGALDQGDLVGLRLADGTQLGAVALDPPGGGSAVPVPVQMGSGERDLVVVLDGERTVIVDPAADWTSVDALVLPSRPLGAGVVRQAGGEPAPGFALVLARRAGDRVSGLVVVDVARGSAGPEVSGGWEVTGDAVGSLPAVGVAADGGEWAVPPGWNGDVDADGCPDLVVPLLVVRCPTNAGSGPGGVAAAVRHGPAWVTTRPIAMIPGEPARLLVAASLAWDPGGNGLQDPLPLPAWAATGGWRPGPSGPFALAELPAADLTYFADFPTPVPTVDRSVGRDPLETTIAARSGDRAIVRWRPIDADQVEADVEAPRLRASLAAPLADGERALVLRSPVNRSGLSGVEDGPIRLPLADPGEVADQRAWRIDIVAVNDWGEIGGPVATHVTLDVLGPGLVVDVPVVSAPWPFKAPITGRAEPGARITLGEETAEANRVGRFELRTPLAPWPQDLVIRALDAEGNETVRRVSVMGGLDVRRLPWQAALVGLVLAAIAWTAFRGAGLRPGGDADGRQMTGAVTAEEVASATIEDLEPSDSTGRRV